jgi:uncharacterized protein YjiS (DUF1127 family)
MSNMSYCRFRNTLGDLNDCLDALEDIGGDLSELGDEEAAAAKRLIEMCRQIADDYGSDDA